MKPFFSIVVPCYNRAGYLPDLFSMLALQSYSQFETIVVDDGSTDNTGEIASGAALPGLHYHKQANAGVSAARNAGAALAQGQYLVFLDSDDQVTTGWLKDFYTSLQTSDADFALCAMKRVLPEGEVVEKPIIGAAAGPRQVSHNIPGSFAIRTALFRQAGGYDERLKFGENTELFLRVRPWQLRHVIVDAVNFIYHPHPQGGARNRSNRIAANPYVVKKHSEYFNASPRLKQQYLQVAGVDSMVIGQYLRGWRFLAQGWMATPFSAKAFARFFLGCCPPLARYFWKRNKY